MNKHSLLVRLLVGTVATLGLASCEQRSRGPTEPSSQNMVPPMVTQPQVGRIQLTPPADATQPKAAVDDKPSSTGLLPASEKVDLAVYRNAQRLIELTRSLALTTNTAAPVNHSHFEMEGR
jgi:hypothetical protein